MTMMDVCRDAINCEIDRGRRMLIDTYRRLVDLKDMDTTARRTAEDMTRTALEELIRLKRSVAHMDVDSRMKQDDEVIESFGSFELQTTLRGAPTADSYYKILMRREAAEGELYLCHARQWLKDMTDEEDTEAMKAIGDRLEAVCDDLIKIEWLIGHLEENEEELLRHDMRVSCCDRSGRPVTKEELI